MRRLLLRLRQIIREIRILTTVVIVLGKMNGNSDRVTVFWDRIRGFVGATREFGIGGAGTDEGFSWGG